MHKTMNGLVFLAVLSLQVVAFGQGVDGDTVNVASRGIATQSSEHGGGAFPASLGIDGNFGNFTHTGAGQNLPSTWEVDLRDEYEITSIVLHNRRGCCPSRFRDLTVLVLDAPDGDVLFESDLLNEENPIGGGVPSAAPDSLVVDLVELLGEPVAGSVVRVVRTPDPDLSGTGGVGNADEADVLSLAEVEIFSPADGLPPPPPPPPPLEPIDEGVNPGGWIRSNAWNMLFLNQDGGCGGGGFLRMEGNWVEPHDLLEENPRPGDEWDIDFFAAEAGGWGGDRVNDIPTWVSMNSLRALAAPLVPTDLVDFNSIASQAGFMSNDNIVAVSTTYVENTTGEPMRVQVCTASDDSIRLDINNHNVTLVSSCRGSAGDCQEINCGELAPGMNKITAYVWEGGGGWNMRIGLRDASMQILDDFSEGVIFHGTGEDDELEGQEVAEAPDCSVEGVNPFGWLRTEAWNMLFLDQDGGCAGGGAGRMAGNWVAPYDLDEEDPRAGDDWDIDFFEAESSSWPGAALSELPIWLSSQLLEDAGFRVPVGDLVDFNAISSAAGFPGTDNIVAISTTYVENTTGGPMRVEVCTASDDSIRLDVNNYTVTLVSACRVSAGNCQETRCADLEPGINKITTYVWEGGGGWNMRIGFRDENGLVLNDQSEGIVFHGTSEFDDLEGQIIDNPPEECVEQGPPPPPDDEGYVNVGPNGFATQSSECCGGNPNRAIDGNTNGQWAAGSITHTDGPDSWWEVDLQDTYYISYMRIWNRLDCCSERLTNFPITVLDFEREVLWEETFLPDGGQINGAFLSIEDVESDGQFVRVSMPGQNLSIAELEILSPDGDPPPPGEICDNGLDDDGDGDSDCDDADCSDAQSCQPPADEICDNGLDDDEDGDADCNDADCSEAANCQPSGPLFVRGDTNSDGSINLTDGVIPLLYLFSGGAPPDCFDSADTNDTGNIEITDAIIVFGWLFSGGAAPAAPSPLSPGYSREECAEDPTEDGIGCDRPAPSCN